jgi:hypothetical protein
MVRSVRIAVRSLPPNWRARPIADERLVAFDRLAFTANRVQALVDEMPFLLAPIRCAARTHLCSPILLRSNTVPTVTVYCSRQSLH